VSLLRQVWILVHPWSISVRSQSLVCRGLMPSAPGQVALEKGGSGLEQGLALEIVVQAIGAPGGRCRGGEPNGDTQAECQREVCRPWQWVPPSSGHVVAQDLEVVVLDQVRDVVFGAGEEVAHAQDVVPICEQARAEMRSGEAGTAGHADAFAYEMGSGVACL